MASLKKEKSVGDDKIPAEPVQAGGENIVDVLTDLENTRKVFPMDSVADYYTT